ncbi:glycosyltransferase family 2 protein [Nocardioides sp.]|uniref:glycosyltransferase family 2 protein n=1 Tax=Nocardioides sp. TaxID=35761 RepID=UPI002F3EC4EB
MTRRRTAAAWVGLLVLVAGQARRHHHKAARRASAHDVRAAALDGALAGAQSDRADDRPLLAVVMAAYNEAGSIGPLLASLPEQVCGLGVCPVVVDDGSTDQTAELAREAGSVVGTHRSNLGQGDALRTGFAMAQRLDARVVVTMDADGQHDPSELPALVGPIVAGDADYVQGSRFLGTYDDAGGARDLGIRGFTQLIRLLTGTEITDCTNGFRAIDGAALRRMRLVEDRFSASEILIQAAGLGLRIREVPVHIRSREVGTSKKPRGLRYASGFLGAIIRSWARARDPRSGARETA